MKYSVVFLLFSVFAFSQNSKNEIYRLSETQYGELKNFLQSKNVEIRDTIFIKYDYNKENCWNELDRSGKKRILGIVERFQNNIKNFNNRHKDAIAVNFRESGDKFNKLKLWDNTIIIDENLYLKNLMFSQKNQCGNSAVIFSDRSYLMLREDPHFELLEIADKHQEKF